MNEQTIYTACSSLISLGGLAYLAFWRFPQYRLDLFRQKMFILRDNLFIEAAEGLIDFNHPAYGLLRRTMNGFLRFGHRLNPWQFFFLLILRAGHAVDEKGPFETNWLKHTRDLNPQTKERLLHYRKEMEKLVAEQLLIGSPDSYLLLVFIIASLFVYAGWRVLALALSPSRKLLSVQTVWQGRLTTIDEAALLIGQDVEYA